MNQIDIAPGTEYELDLTSATSPFQFVRKTKSTSFNLAGPTYTFTFCLGAISVILLSATMRSEKTLIFFFCCCSLGHTHSICKFAGYGSNWSYSCWPTPQPQPCRIRAVSAAYTTAHSNAGSLTYWGRPGIEPTSSWILVRFVSDAPWWELQILIILTFHQISWWSIIFTASC